MAVAIDSEEPVPEESGDAVVADVEAEKAESETPMIDSIVDAVSGAIENMAASVIDSVSEGVVEAVAVVDVAVVESGECS